MLNNDKKDHDLTDEEQLLELEYELLESTEKRRPKRLRAKEKKSKKADSQMLLGRVLECFTNNYYRVKTDSQEFVCPLSGRFKNVDFANTRSIVVVGDYVKVDVSGEPRVEEIADRKNVLVRYIPKQNTGSKSVISSSGDIDSTSGQKSDRRENKEVVIAANIDQVIITTSFKNPDINLNLVDRYICSAGLTDVTPVICITKSDLTTGQQIFKDMLYYENSGYTVLYISNITGSGIDALIEVLKNKTTVFSGPSGVGKSSTINRLEPSLNLKTGSISSYSNKGRHVTSNSMMMEWSFGGYLIDTPGIKTFGLPKKAKEHLPRLFPGFASLAVRCKYTSCTHTKEEGCKVLEELEKATIPEARYQSYLNLMNSI